MSATRGIVFVLLSLECVAGEPEWNDYVRVLAKRTRDGHSLWLAQSSTRELVHPRTGARIYLSASVHVGEASYFRSREPQLRRAELVLAEGYRPDREPVPKEIRWIRRDYRAIAKVADLSTETEWRRRVMNDRWVSGDISWQRMLQIYGDKKNAFLSAEDKARILRIEALQLADLPRAERGRTRRLWRRYLVGQLVAADPLPQRQDSVERERVLFEHVKAAVSSNKHKTIAVVFGALHLYRVEPRLVSELGYRYQSSVWHDVVSYLQESKPAETPGKRSEAGSGGR